MPGDTSALTHDELPTHGAELTQPTTKQRWSRTCSPPAPARPGTAASPVQAIGSEAMSWGHCAEQCWVTDNKHRFYKKHNVIKKCLFF